VPLQTAGLPPISCSMTAMGVLLAACLSAASAATSTLPKILALHGGDETAADFQTGPGIAALVRDLASTYEFVFVTTPYSDKMWFDSANDEALPARAFAFLNTTVAAQGPFHGIIGYSQGAGAALGYLGTAPPGTFKMAAFYTMAPPEAPAVIANLNARSPFDNMPSLFFIGGQDQNIPDPSATGHGWVSKFTNATVITSPTTGHQPPASSDSTYSTILNWYRQHSVSTGSIPPTPAPPAPPTGKTVAPTPGASAGQESASTPGASAGHVVVPLLAMPLLAATACLW